MLDSAVRLILTPTAHDDNRSPDAHLAMKKRMKGGERNTITSLQVFAKAIAQDKLPQNQICFAIPSSMPTPQSRDWMQGSKPDSDRIKRKKSQGYSLNLNDKVLEFSTLPTPTSRDWKHGSSGQVDKKRSDNLNNRCAAATGETRLNPYFVEAMMGFPVGWTDLECHDIPEPNLLSHEDLHEALQFSTCGKLPNHKQRVMAIGNAIVPQVAKLGFDRILELEQQLCSNPASAS